MKTIQTAADIGSWICENVPTVDQQYRNVVDLMIWFVCMRQAASVSSNFSLKDIASLFSDGITPIKTESQVQNWLDTCWEDVDSDDEEGILEVNTEIVDSLKLHFGVE